jgi:membrane protein DedA with SNARE-associated domain
MTSEVLARLTTLLQAAGPWLGPILGGAAFAEALVIVGILVPVTPLLVVSGAAMGVGVLGLDILPWITTGGFLGGLTSYELARKLRAQGRSLRLPYRAKIVAEHLFLRHGAAAILIARFMGPPASVAPFLAGWSGLPRARFVAANAMACLAWPPAMMGLGFVGAWLTLHR